RQDLESAEFRLRDNTRAQQQAGTEQGREEDRQRESGEDVGADPPQVSPGARLLLRLLLRDERRLAALGTADLLAGQLGLDLELVAAPRTGENQGARGRHGAGG